MVKRARKKATKKSVKRRKTTKSKPARKRASKTVRKKRKSPARKKRSTPLRGVGIESSLEMNRRALWATYRELQARVNHALSRLRMHFKSNAMPDVLQKDKQELLFLLGECNYMARACSEAEKSADKNWRASREGRWKGGY